MCALNTFVLCLVQSHFVFSSINSLASANSASLFEQNISCFFGSQHQLSFFVLVEFPLKVTV